jgi:hypothetical protein
VQSISLQQHNEEQAKATLSPPWWCEPNKTIVECVFISASAIQTRLVYQSRHSSCVGSWKCWGSEVL